MALIVGGVGVFIYVNSLLNVGGLYAAYDNPYGGGWATTGWGRDFRLLVIPGIVLLYLSQRGRKWNFVSIGLLCAFMAPLLIHGFVGSRRGFFFMGMVTLIVGWYLTRDRRPALSSIVMGGVVVGLTMLVLVTYRDQLYFGSPFFENPPSVTEMVTHSVERVGEADYGHGYIYAGYSILLARERGEYYWGRRYFAYTFVRPIPSTIWPTKYQDMGVSGIRRNGGTLGEGGDNPMYEKLPPGQLPGFVGDLYVEFWWGAIPAAFLLGLCFGVLWRRTLTHGGLWTVLYTCAIAFSAYVVTQTVGFAFIGRMLIAGVPTAMVWYLMSGQQFVFLPEEGRSNFGSQAEILEAS